MFAEKGRVSTGLKPLDQRLDSLLIGDNVIWYDEAGSLVFPFTFNLIQVSKRQEKAIVYVTFDRSPRNLLDALGPLAQNPQLTILDCFTCGKGEGSDIFAKFYPEAQAEWPCRVIKVEAPWQPENVSAAIYGIHKELTGDVRFVFESLTGMQALWEGEEHILKFYSRSCPRLYELDTIAYWIVEKGAHSHRLKAQINQVAQVVIELSIQRGKSTLSIVKAQNRRRDNLNKSEIFWADGMTVAFDADQPMAEKIDIGSRLRRLRTRKGVSQKKLAAMVGVTPSTISQIESNLIYPSLPGLIKIAQVMSVGTAYFFNEMAPEPTPVIFSDDSQAVMFPNLPKGCIDGRHLLPEDLPAKVEPFLLKIAPGQRLPAHFFIHKGEEFGYLISGQLTMTIGKAAHVVRSGNTIFLNRDIPTQWRNGGTETAVLLWVKVA